MAGGRAACRALALTLACAAAPVAAQQGGAPATGPAPETAPAQGQTPPQMPFLIVDQDALFLRSAFGQRIRADVAARMDALAAENRRIESELVAEEQDLTKRRETMPADQFRKLADAFDRKVTATRSAQDAKSLAIERAGEEAQQAFFGQAGRILSALMRERGAVAILDGRTVLLATDAVDVTAAAVARIDAELGEGQGLAVTDGAGGAAPQDSAPQPDGPQDGSVPAPDPAPAAGSDGGEAPKP
ncbi:OmpH family outer membrane protein [Oceaniglobus roseus]|uniref:OmpH family outer membrane protein n=1 Tax=Oceaniglobus roseus TaxID=1737570 RepID=UPI000C7EF4B1|nr:OmpH family outer membrane protein [Kandeliimicrobium roseum]